MCVCVHACVRQEVRPLQTNGTSSSLILRPHLVSFSDLFWHTCHFQYTIHLLTGLDCTDARVWMIVVAPSGPCCYGNGYQVLVACDVSIKFPPEIQYVIVQGVGQICAY